jgi:hypothetical protein
MNLTFFGVEGLVAHLDKYTKVAPKEIFFAVLRAVSACVRSTKTPGTKAKHVKSTTRVYKRKGTRSFKK